MESRTLALGIFLAIASFLEMVLSVFLFALEASSVNVLATFVGALVFLLIAIICFCKYAVDKKKEQKDL